MISTSKAGRAFCATLMPLVLSIALCGCMATQSSEPMYVAPEVVEVKGRYLKQYVLSVGDRIEVSVWQVPEVSRVVQVRPDGRISLPTVSDVQAAGLSFEELEAELTTRLSERLRDPLVSVIAVDIRAANVYVLGQVAAPRAVPLRDAASAIEAIAMAGGMLRGSSSPEEVSIIRLGDDGVLRAIPVGVTVDGQPGAIMALSIAQLQADDIVYVPESSRSQATRFLDDFVGRPLQYIASGLLSYRIVSGNPL